MNSTNYSLTKYEADEGKYFDWKVPRYRDVIGEDGKPTGEQEQEHLNAKTLFLGHADTITNYVEVDANGNITELQEPEIAHEEDYVNALAELGVTQ